MERWIGPLALRLALLAGVMLAVATRLHEHVLLVAPNVHGVAKVGLGLAQTMLWRLPVLPWVLGGAALALAVVPALPASWRLAGLGVAVAALLALPGAQPIALVLGVGLLVANARGLDDRGARRSRIRWIPGAELLLPVPVLDNVGMPRVGAVPAASRALLALPLALTWWVADAAAGMPAHVRSVLAWDRPLDDGLRVVARAPDGIGCEFHDIDLLPDRYHVLQEGSFRLVARARDDDRVLGEEILPPWWGPTRGLVLDSESDGDRTWYLRVPDTLLQLRWNGRGWNRESEVRIGSPITHSYIHRVPELDRLVVHEIGVGHSTNGRVLSVRTDDLGDLRDLVIRTEDGARPPRARDVEWVPPLKRFVLAPDMGDRLWLEDPLTGLASPWTELPTLNGKLLWVPGLERLLVAVPSRGAVLVLTADGVVERELPAPFGVRPVGVDVARGLYVVASVVTASVEVRRLEDGALVKRLGSVMPMVREIRLDPDTGEGWLSTWTVLYRFRYAE